MKKLLLFLLLFASPLAAQTNTARMLSGVNTVTSCPYTIQATDTTKLLVINTSSACSITLPAATTANFGTGAIFSVRNLGTGTATITTASGTIDGGANLVLTASQGADIYSDGANYESQKGSSAGGTLPFNELTTGTNTTAHMTVGSGAALDTSGSGTIAATSVPYTGITSFPPPCAAGLYVTEIANPPTCTPGGAFYQTLQVNGTPQTQRSIFNLVPPMTSVDNAGNASSDISVPVFAEGTPHNSGLVPDPGAAPGVTKYLREDTTWAVPPGGAGGTTVPDPSVAIQYVAPLCNAGAACSDANDGLTWGTAKLTIYAAICSLPAGDCSTKLAGNGTVFVGPSPTMNPTSSDAGIWLMGPHDPNYASPPSGWLKCNNNSTCSLSVIGVPGNVNASPNGHKPRVLLNVHAATDRNKPIIWISGTTTSIDFSNFQGQYAARAFVIGECSNNLRDNTCPVTGITFDNMGALLNQTAANGPCTDITGASYWLWFKDFTCAGNAYTATGGRFADNAAAILVDGSSNTGNGLIHVNDANFAGGGIKFIPGGNGGSLYVNNITEEGDFNDNIPPPVWFTSFPAQTTCRVSNVTIADAGPAGTIPVRVDSGSGLTGGCLVDSTSSTSPIVGPSTVLSQDNRALINESVSPRLYNQNGFFNGYMLGETDVARRIGGLTPSRFANSALTDSSGWVTQASGGSATLTQGVTDPFGGTGAATASMSSGSGTLYLGPNGNSCTFIPYNPAAGDWIITGGWIKQAAGKTTVHSPIKLTNCSFPLSTYSATYENIPITAGDGNWSYVWGASKVASGSATRLGINIDFTTSPLSVYGPTFYLIPAGTISDNEVLEFASSMNSIDANCPPGSICNVAGHPVSADVFTLRPTVAPTGASGKTQFYMDGTANWPSFKPNGNTAYVVPGFTGSITNAANVCASGTSGAITTVGCVGASGNINNALFNSLAFYSTAGTTNVISGLNGPTTPASVPQFVLYNPSGGVSGAPTTGMSGVVTRASVCPSNLDTILATDRSGYVSFSNANPCAVTLPQAGTTGFTSNFAFATCNIGVGAATITPTTSTISYATGSAYTAGASSLALTTGQCASVFSDNSNYFAVLKTGGAGAPTFPVTVAGAVTSGGIPYFNSTTQESSSALLSTGALVVGGGAGNPPTVGAADFTYSSHTLAGAASSIFDMSAAGTLKVPVSAGGNSAADGQIAYDSTAKSTHVRTNGADSVVGAFASAPAGSKCVHTNGVTGLLTETAGDCSNSASLSAITAASGTNSISNGNNNQTWQAQLSSTNDFLDIAESAASSGTGALFNSGTLGTSTAYPARFFATGSATNTFGNSVAVDIFNPTTAPSASFGENSPQLRFAGSYWNGSSGAADTWTLQNLIGSGTNGTSVLQFTHAGSAGNAFVSASQYGAAFYTNTGSSVAASFGGVTFNPTTAASTLGVMTFKGGDFNGGSGSGNAQIAGDALFRGGNSASTNTNAGSRAGNITIQPGANTGVASASLEMGKLILNSVFFNTGTTNVGDLACVTATNTVASCASGGADASYIGIVQATATNQVYVQTQGVATVNSSGSASFTAGHYACTDNTNAGKVVDSASACTAGQGVGIVLTTETSTTGHVVVLRSF